MDGSIKMATFTLMYRRWTPSFTLKTIRVYLNLVKGILPKQCVCGNKGEYFANIGHKKKNIQKCKTKKKKEKRDKRKKKLIQKPNKNKTI